MSGLSTCQLIVIAWSCLVAWAAEARDPTRHAENPDLADVISVKHDISGVKTYMVAMRDGVELATDVLIPRTKVGKKVPAVLIRTPYNREGLVGAEAAKNIPKFGMASVVQDMRGRFGSEGEDFPIFAGCGWSKVQDGYDTIEWVAKQPWCNGQVATIGPSAMGITQNLTLPTQPPHHVCAFVMVAASNMYHQAAYWGGAPRKSMAENWTSEHGVDPRNRDLFRAHPCYDEFWDAWNVEKQAPRVNVPVLYYGGWYDIFSQGTINSFVTSHTQGGPGARGRCRLIMGPWVHGGLPRKLRYPNNAKPQLALWALEWMTRHLKGADKAGARRPKPIRYYVMGACEEEKAPGNVWRSAATWPLPSKTVAHYFHKGNLLSTHKPTDASASASYDYDPKNPVPTRGGTNLTIANGPMDQRPVENRPDVILFTTPELSAPVEATGRIKVKLWVSSSCKDTDFTAKLCDVYPDGRSMLVVDGIIRARYRESFSQPKLMAPGKVYPIEIDLWSTSIIFNKGHRIRVAVSSSNAPRFGPNPNTGEPMAKSQGPLVARNTIYFDKDRPSHIVLPRPILDAAASASPSAD
jgi:predicted acyl esterase